MILRSRNFTERVRKISVSFRKNPPFAARFATARRSVFPLRRCLLSAKSFRADENLSSDREGDTACSRKFTESGRKISVILRENPLFAARFAPFGMFRTCLFPKDPGAFRG